MVVSPKIDQFSVFKLIFIIWRVFVIFARKCVVEGSYFLSSNRFGEHAANKNNYFYCEILRFHDHLRFRSHFFIAILGIEANIF